MQYCELIYRPYSHFASGLTDGLFFWPRIQSRIPCCIGLHCLLGLCQPGTDPWPLFELHVLNPLKSPPWLFRRMPLGMCGMFAGSLIRAVHFWW